MSLLEKVFFGVALGYVATGAVLSLVVGFDDLRKKRISLVGFVDYLASIASFFQFLYLLLWPFWYFTYRSAEKKDRQYVAVAYGPDQAKYLQKEPNQPPQGTPGKAPFASTEPEARRH